MSALIALILLAAAAWFLSSMAGGPATGRREPMDSVSDFARAMRALDPTAPPATAPTGTGRPPRRPTG